MRRRARPALPSRCCRDRAPRSGVAAALGFSAAALSFRGLSAAHDAARGASGSLPTLARRSATTIWYESPQRIRASLAIWPPWRPKPASSSCANIPSCTSSTCSGTPGAVVGATRGAGSRRDRLRDRPLSTREHAETAPRRRCRNRRAARAGPPRRRDRQDPRRARLRRAAASSTPAPRRASAPQRAARQPPVSDNHEPRLLRHHADLLHQRRIRTSATPIRRRGRRLGAHGSHDAGPAFFLTGTDEHGQKVANAAAAAGKTPQEWCDELVPRWQALFAAYHVAYDDFIRTTSRATRRKVQRVFERLRENGDIYLGKYEGWYCVNDETFWLGIETRRRPLSDLRARGAMDLGRRLVFPAFGVSRPADRALPRESANGCAAQRLQRDDGAARRGARRSLDLARPTSTGAFRFRAAAA